MKEKIKLLLLYLLITTITHMISIMFLQDLNSIKTLICIMIVNVTILIFLMKYTSIDKVLVPKFLFLIFLLFIPLIIDNDYFLSAYIQSTPTTFFSEKILAILSIILYPHTYIFYILYRLDMLQMCFIIIPVYLYLIYSIMKKVL